MYRGCNPDLSGIGSVSGSSLGCFWLADVVAWEAGARVGFFSSFHVPSKYMFTARSRSPRQASRIMFFISGLTLWPMKLSNSSSSKGTDGSWTAAGGSDLGGVGRLVAFDPSVPRLAGTRAGRGEDFVEEGGSDLTGIPGCDGSGKNRSGTGVLLGGLELRGCSASAANSPDSLCLFAGGSGDPKRVIMRVFT